MKYVKVTSILTGESRLVPADEYLLGCVNSEIRDCNQIIKEHPNMGTVLDGSRFSKMKVLESLERRINCITDRETIFTDFYKSLQYDIDSLTDMYENTEDVYVKCTLLGQRQGYIHVRGIIDKINKTKEG